MGQLGQDLRYALRGMRRSPGQSAVAILCLAIGIGVNAAAFGVLDALLARDFPGITRRHELATVSLSHETPWGPSSPAPLSVADWQELREGLPSFSGVAVVGRATVAFRGSAEPRAVRGDFVSGRFFSVLGTVPAAGRLLTPDDDDPGSASVVVIGHDLWHRDFGGRPDAVGEVVQVGTRPFTIVGVAPEGFCGLDPGELIADPARGAPSLFLPLAASTFLRVESRTASPDTALDDTWLVLVGRLRPGERVQHVQAQADAAAARIEGLYPKERRHASARVRPGIDGSSRAETMAGIVFVMAIPALILLVACANVANQLLARAVQRSREIAVRLSLGASRARIVRQQLVESMVLALGAGAAGVLVARWITDALRAFFLAIPFRIPIDARVLLFAVAVALGTTLVFGLVPALRASRTDLAWAMKAGSSRDGYRRSVLRDGLVVVQVAASVALLALAGVFVRATERARIAPMDVSADRLLTATLDLDLVGYSVPAGRAFQALAMERLRSIPGVEAVALAPFPPLGSVPEQEVSPAGDASGHGTGFDVAEVLGDWFAVRNTRALRGRLFTPEEARGVATVAVVDEAAADRLWPQASPVGQPLRIGDVSTGRIATVIGVVATARTPDGRRGEGIVIVPGEGRYAARAVLYVRTRGNAEALRAPVRDVLRELDARLPVVDVGTLRESLSWNAAPASLLASGVGAMGALAVFLASLGLGAVLSFVVAQRRYEIGVRIALGAGSTSITRMVLGQAFRMTALGIAIGAVTAAAAATLLRSLLFGLPPIDPIAFGGSTLIILAVSIVSSVAPARRAAAVDPIETLRTD